MRSSWVIGEGHNFVKTMRALSDRVADPEDKLEQVTVVDDQLGRLTFTRDMTQAIFHVLGSRAPYGTYDCTGSGAVKSWADIARAVFEAANATATGSCRYRPPTTTPAPRAPWPRARSTPRSTFPGSSRSGSTCPTGRKSLGSTSRRSSRYQLFESKSRRSLTAAFLVDGYLRSGANSILRKIFHSLGVVADLPGWSS